MMRKHARNIVLIFALLPFTPAATAPSCNPAQKRSVEQNVVRGLQVTAWAVEPGIDAMRALREAGEVDVPTNIFLARRALEVNVVARALSQAALDGADAEDLREQLDVLVELAERLEREGTLKLKNGDVKLVFKLRMIAVKGGLAIALDEFKAGGGAGLSFTLDADTRKSLEDLLPVFERNDALLRGVVVRLGRE